MPTEMDYRIWLSLGACCLGIAGLLYAQWQCHERAKLEAVVKDTFQRLAGDIRTISQNALGADAHFCEIAIELSKAEPNLELLREKLVFELRDGAASARQLSLFHSRLKGVQYSLFNDDLEIVSELSSDQTHSAKQPLVTPGSSVPQPPEPQAAESPKPPEPGVGASSPASSVGLLFRKSE
jgi:hypothetical protein